MDRYIIEKRTQDGAYDFKNPQPPTGDFSYHDLAQMFFRANPDSGPSATQEEIREWFNGQGWYFRQKTW